jgi:Mn-containing catalase
MFRWSPDDYRRINEVWNGPHPEDGTDLIVEDGIPDGFAPPDLDAEPQLAAPGVDGAFLAEAAARLFR